MDNVFQRLNAEAIMDRDASIFFTWLGGAKNGEKVGFFNGRFVEHCLHAFADPDLHDEPHGV